MGIPTWQDLTDLSEGHTDEELRSVLGQDSTANAIAYLTPDVADSTVITRTELPSIVRRIDRGDGFFLVPAIAGGADYKDVTTIAGTYLGTHDLGQWNVSKIKSDPINTSDSQMIAARVLKKRMQSIHAKSSNGHALKLQLHTRKSPAKTSGNALTLDWTHRFNGREADPTSWNDYLLPATESVAKACERFAPGRAITVEGLCAIPAAIALGVAFLAPRGIDARWNQASVKLGDQVWGLGFKAEPIKFVAKIQSADVSADDIAVLVSVASDVNATFGASRASLPRFRAIISVEQDGVLPHGIASPGQATAIAEAVSGAIRKARQEFQTRGTVHLFLAVPVGLAFMIGQSLNTLGGVQTYEHIPTDAVGTYRPAALLAPSL